MRKHRKTIAIAAFAFVAGGVVASHAGLKALIWGLTDGNVKAVNQVFKGTGLTVGAGAGANTLGITIDEGQLAGGLDVEVREGTGGTPSPNIIALLLPGGFRVIRDPVQPNIIALLLPGGWRINTPSSVVADPTAPQLLQLVGPTP